MNPTFGIPQFALEPGSPGAFVVIDELPKRHSLHKYNVGKNEPFVRKF